MTKGERPNSSGKTGPAEMTLTSGEVIRIYPISLDLVQEIEAQFVPPPVPEMETKMADGMTEKVPYPTDPEYVAALEELSRQKGEATLRLICIQGLKDIKVSPEDDWVEELQFVHPTWTPPESRLELKMDYIRYWLITHRQDWEVLIKGSISASVLTPEDVEAAMLRFRSEVAGVTSKQIGDAIDAAFVQHGAGGEPDGDGDEADPRGVASAAEERQSADGGDEEAGVADRVSTE